MKITGVVGLCDGNCKVKEKASVNHANAYPWTVSRDEGLELGDIRWTVWRHLPLTFAR